MRGYRAILLITVFLCTLFNLKAQQLTGTVVDGEHDFPLTGALVFLSHLPDSVVVKESVVDSEGKFILNDIEEGEYLLSVFYVGYTDFQQNIRVESANKDLGALSMLPSEDVVEEFTIESKVLQLKLMGDTTEYNASSYKTNPDATAEDLITKMPGITSDGGKVKAHGEDVKKVLVDGKEFFGNDPAAALKNLPAEAIDKIQVYDKENDASRMSGVSDGETEKTINIITKPGMKNGVFGKAYAGYGTDERYWSGGNINFFNGNRRISLIGLSNNINIQNFNMDDLTSMNVSGGYSGRGYRRRGGAGDFLVGQQNGISTTHAFGVNYADTWGKKMDVTASYFINWSENNNNGNLSRNYFSTEAGDRFYDEVNLDSRRDMNHRLNFRLEYEIDSMNSLWIIPRLSVQDNRSTSYSDGLSLLNDTLQSSTLNDYESENLAFNFSNEIMFRHDFRKKGRTLSLRLETEINNRDGNTDLYSQNTYPDTVEIIDQLADNKKEGYEFEPRFTYTEPLGEKTSLELDYRPQYNINNQDKVTQNLDSLTNEYTILDTNLTSVYKNTYHEQKLGLRFRLEGEKSSLVAGLYYQYSVLKNDQNFPKAYHINNTYGGLLPYFRYKHEFSKSSSLRLFYKVWTSTPSVSQLQEVVDNSNPLLLKVGNADLKQDYTNFGIIRYSNIKKETMRSFFFFFMLRQANNYIGNSTIIASQDTVTADGIILQEGAQLNRPVNLDGYWNIYSNFSYGIPVTKLKCNLDFNGGVNFTRTPALINGAQNIATNYTLNGGLTISSNISKKIDFKLTYKANYGIVLNSILPEQDNNYYFQTAGGNFNWLFGKGFVFNTALDYTLYTGLGDQFNQDYILWNIGLGYKFLKDDLAELRLTVFDLLKQNNSIARNVTDTYVEDAQTQVLQRYLMLTFTYNFRHFKAADKSAN